jgi:hypothetical protein
MVWTRYLLPRANLRCYQDAPGLYITVLQRCIPCPFMLGSVTVGGLWRFRMPYT